MNKITRLSLFNIKKHKMESFSLGLLLMFCMVLIGSSLSSGVNISNLLPTVIENTQAMENYMLIPQKDFTKDMLDTVSEDERVTDLIHARFVYDMNTRYINKNGTETSLPFGFISREDEPKLENFDYESSLSEEEIAAMPHPLFAPYTMKDSLHINEGDEFTVIYGSRKFTFTVAGYYSSLFLSNTNTGLKLVVEREDFCVLESLLQKYELIAYNASDDCNTDTLYDELLKKLEETSHSDIETQSIGLSLNAIKMIIKETTSLFLDVMKIMAGVIIISVVVMIRSRITSDISEQIDSIGVLEALGYKSGEITLSYVMEYVIIAAAGIIAGFLGCTILSPFLFSTGEKIAGFHTVSSTAFAPIFATAGAILLFIAVIAYMKAASLKKYSPVQALRKGINDNHFRKNHFSVKKTKGNVNLRLSLKGCADNIRQALGFAICMTAACVTVMLSFILYSFLSDKTNIIRICSGEELSSIQISLVNPNDSEELCKEILKIDGVRKVVPCSESISSFVNSPDDQTYMIVVAFDDFNDTETIFPCKGRFPEHDNEVMITNSFAKRNNYNIGDSIKLEADKVERDYIITGFVTSMTNQGLDLYITNEGYKRIRPAYVPNAIAIYLDDNALLSDINNTITQKFGRSLADVSQDTAENASTEEKIRAEAEKKIAEMMSVHGADHIEYSIKIGDEMISSSSSGFKIKSMMNIAEIIDSQLESICAPISIAVKVFMFISAVVVAIIILMLMESSIRKQRREFGIMKAMGYTSKELMFQLAFRIVPPTVLSVTAGIAASAAAAGLFANSIGNIPVNFASLIILSIFVTAFCFTVAFFGARKIRNISVCELMTE